MEVLWPQYDLKCDLSWPPVTSKKNSTDIEWLIKRKVITTVSSSSACLPKLVFNACRWTTEVINFHLINHSIYAEIFGHMEVKWPQNDLKCWQVNYWGHYLHLICHSMLARKHSFLWSWRSSEVTFSVKLSPMVIQSKQMNYWGNYLLFDMSLDISWDFF